MTRAGWDTVRLDIFPRLHGVAACPECAAIVADEHREKHERWHQFTKPMGPIA